MFDWQAITAALIVLAALVYTGRRAWSRLRSFRAARGSAASSACETGCGSSGGDAKPKAATPRTVFVEIGRRQSKR